MFFVLLADYTFFMAGSFTFFLIALGFFEPRDYRVVFFIQKTPLTPVRGEYYPRYHPDLSPALGTSHVIG